MTKKSDICGILSFLDQTSLEVFIANYFFLLYFNCSRHKIKEYIKLPCKAAIAAACSPSTVDSEPDLCPDEAKAVGCKSN